MPSGSPFWSGPGSPNADGFREFAAAIVRCGPDAVAASLDRLIARRADAFISGIEGYRNHPYRRQEAPAAVCWQQGAARLLDYGGDGVAPPVLIVPSLINRHYILDLLPERSFVRHLAAAGLRPLVLDWGEPGAAERSFTLSNYIAGPLVGALNTAVALTGRPVALLGYCMGGLLALAAALRRRGDIACLALLATPWDFHAERAAQGRLLSMVIEALPRWIGAGTPVPVSVIQTLFLALDPTLGERKFVRFADAAPTGAAARSFVALEDWINDGVPLAYPVASECARSWYRDNEPARGSWRVARRPVRPEEIGMPSLIVLPRRDRIVPPASAAPLAAAIPGATVLHPRSGHIGMMASAEAPAAVWQPIASWLRAQFA